MLYTRDSYEVTQSIAGFGKIPCPVTQICAQCQIDDLAVFHIRSIQEA